MERAVVLFFFFFLTNLTLPGNLCLFLLIFGTLLKLKYLKLKAFWSLISFVLLVSGSNNHRSTQ